MRGLTKFLVWMGGIFGAICLLLHLFVFDEWVVPHAPEGQFFAVSILPALMPDDKILLRRGSSPQVGELARCAHPTSSGQWVVGRVFGTPGDRVEVTDRAVTTNGKALAAAHGCPPMVVANPITDNLVTLSCGVVETGAWSFSHLQGDTGLSAGKQSAVVESGKVFLVSDNRLMHEDSRDFGQVDSSTCEHIVYRLWGERFSDSSRRFTILW